jgi:hypothetical protein
LPEVARSCLCSKRRLVRNPSRGYIPHDWEHPPSLSLVDNRGRTEIFVRTRKPRRLTNDPIRVRSLRTWREGWIVRSYRSHHALTMRLPGVATQQDCSCPTKSRAWCLRIAKGPAQRRQWRARQCISAVPSTWSASGIVDTVIPHCGSRLSRNRDRWDEKVDPRSRIA